MGMPQIDPHDRTRLIANGRQLFLTGYYPGLQALTSGTRPKDGWYRSLIDNLARHGVNNFRVVSTFGMALGNGPWIYPYAGAAEDCAFTPPGRVAWTTPKKRNLDQIEPSFLDYWDSVVSYAHDHGITVQMCIFDGYHTKDVYLINGIYSKDCNTNSCADIMNPLAVGGIAFDFYCSNNNVNGVAANTTGAWYTDTKTIRYQKQYLIALVNKLKGYPNLIWEICNETPTLEGIGDWEINMFQTLRALDSEHLIMPFDLPDHRDVPGQLVPSQNSTQQNTCCNGRQNWTTANYVSVANGLVRARKQGFTRFQPGGHPQPGYEPKPMISDNDYSVCVGEPELLPGRQRKKAWTSLVAGGYSQLLVFNIDCGQPIFQLSDPVVQQGMAMVGLTRAFINRYSIGISGSEPMSYQQGQMWFATNYGSESNPIWALQATSAGQKAYVLYYFLGGTANVGPLKLSHSAQGTWFNPLNGHDFHQPIQGRTSLPSPGVAQGSNRNKDWVLLIVDG